MGKYSQLSICKKKFKNMMNIYDLIHHYISLQLCSDNVIIKVLKTVRMVILELRTKTDIMFGSSQ